LFDDAVMAKEKCNPHFSTDYARYGTFWIGKTIILAINISRVRT
jgi:hypothetical protein